MREERYASTLQFATPGSTMMYERRERENTSYRQITAKTGK
jgi:hypothetical protein